MKKLIVATVACALIGAWGAAQAGDAAKGKAKSAACAGCHGPDGNSKVSMYPKLAGQHEVYLVAAMQQYKSGARPDATMKAMATPLSDTDIADLATYYATQKVQ